MEIQNVLLNGKPVMKGDERRKTVYTCADCKTNLMYKCGKIKVPHFAHYSADCQSLRKANDYLTHKTAILKMQTDLVGGIIITSRCGCKSSHKGNAVLEHPVSNGRADLALLEPLVVFEICHTHKTESRDGQWYEMKALEVLNGVYTCVHECIACQIQTQKNTELKAFRCKEQERLLQEWVANENQKQLEWDKREEGHQYRLKILDAYRLATQCADKIIENQKMNITDKLAKKANEIIQEHKLKMADIEKEKRAKEDVDRLAKINNFLKPKIKPDRPKIEKKKPSEITKRENIAWKECKRNLGY